LAKGLNVAVVYPGIREGLMGQWMEIIIIIINLLVQQNSTSTVRTSIQIQSRNGN